MTTEAEAETRTPRQFLKELGVEIDASDHRPIEEIARFFGHITTTNLDTRAETSE